MKLILVRHAKMAGDPYAEPSSPVTGCLSPEGIAQAEALASALAGTPIDAALSSPYGRAVETADDTPDIPEDLEISVESGALLRLDYPGTNKVGRLRIAGRSFTGLISLATHPELASSLSGPGTLEVTAKGTMVIFR